MSKAAIKVLYLPVEIVERELDSKLLLTIEALERGYEVFIGNYMSLPELAKKIGGGFYLYKAMTDYRADKLFKPLLESGVMSGVLDEEGLIFPSIDYYIKTRIGDGESFKYLSKVFTWGEHQAKEILNFFPINDSLVATTGNPRIDLLRSPYNDAYFKNARALNEQYGDFILINTNFAPGNYSPIFKFSYHEHMRYFGRIHDEADEQYYSERTRYFESLFHSYVEMVKFLSTEIPDIKIIVRPHPSEDHNSWRTSLEGIPNVEIVYEGNVVDWLVAAECVIHTGCTTGLEAFILERPIFRFNPNLRLDMESELPNMLGEGFKNPQTLTTKIKGHLDKSSSYKKSTEQSEYLKRWIENINGDYAYENILQEIDKVEINTVDNIKYVNYLTVRELYKLLKKKFMVILEKAKSLHRFSFIRSLVLRQRQRNQRFSGIPYNKLRARFNKLQNVSGACSDREVDIHRVGIDLFRIKLK